MEMMLLPCSKTVLESLGSFEANVPPFPPLPCGAQFDYWKGRVSPYLFGKDSLDEAEDGRERLPPPIHRPPEDSLPLERLLPVAKPTLAQHQPRDPSPEPG